MWQFSISQSEFRAANDPPDYRVQGAALLGCLANVLRCSVGLLVAHCSMQKSEILKVLPY
jgi:hypothetical protein